MELKFLLLQYGVVCSIHGMEAIPDPEYMLCRDEWLAAANAARFPLFCLQLSVIRYGHKVLAYYSIWI